MAIEYVDPREIEKDPAPGETAAHRIGAAKDNGRLGEVDSKFARALQDLERQVNRLSAVNAGLFGSEPEEPRHSPGTLIGEEAGLIVSLETKTAELRRLVSRLEHAVEETSSLT